MIFSMRHPFNEYTQGLNDILAPIFSVYLSSYFRMSYLQVENNVEFISERLNESILEELEADSYFSLSYLLSEMKENYIPPFKGIKKTFEDIEIILKKENKSLSTFFSQNNVDFLHFGFRWNFCLLLREFPLYLSIRLIDFYLCLDIENNDICKYLMLSLLNKYSQSIMQQN